MNYLFLFSIGPVQSFIAQARKTQDLYGASQLLSDLAKAAIEQAQHEGIDLVFPKTIKGVQSLPNRFIGQIGSDSKEALETVGRNIEQKVKHVFTAAANNALRKTHATETPQFWKQINNHLEINWLFHPIESDDTEGYKKAYQEIEVFMASVKNIRIFEQNEEQGRKCSLDGERNALFFGQDTNDKYLSQGQEISNGIWLNKNEGLSAIGLVKRAYDVQRFPSTAKIALMDYLKEQIQGNSDLSNKYEAYQLRLGGRLQFDEQLCYEENVSMDYLKKNGFSNILKRDSFNEIQALHRSIFSSKDLPKYYAVMAFDGDSMGKVLSGELLHEEKADLAQFQGQVSGLLSNYAQWVWQNVKEPQGAVAYTGGDDFLGFLNLSHLFEVVRRLRYEFDESVYQKLKNKETGDSLLREPFTFSAGIVIAHYKTPLSIVLQKVRELEKTAKNKGKRDAFAIAVLKHSGDMHEACFKWNTLEGMPQWNGLEKLVKYLSDDCSETFIRSLDREFRYITDGDGKAKYPQIIKAELMRLIKKSLKEDKKWKLTEVFNTLERLLSIELKRSGDLADLDNFIEALKIALFIKRKTKINDGVTA